jgi:hypothetical protein
VSIKRNGEQSDSHASLTAEAESEIRLFEELLKLPRSNRARIVEAIRTYDLLELTASDSEPVKRDGR